MEPVFPKVRGPWGDSCREHRTGLDCLKESVQGSKIPGQPSLAQRTALGDEIVLSEGIGGISGSAGGPPGEIQDISGLLKIIDEEVTIDGEGFTGRSGTAQAERQSLYQAEMKTTIDCGKLMERKDLRKVVNWKKKMKRKEGQG